ncbi:hypothetical protein OROMI_034674 [Orobanche minor]
MAVFLRCLSNSDSSEKHCFARFSPCGLRNDLYAPFPHRKHKVVGYCKGLFCLEYDDNREILLWNPWRNEFKFLPSSDLKPPLCPYPDCADTCTVDVISVVRGLGFDPKSGDYKVVRFVGNFYDYDHGCSKQVEVYSLQSDCWKEIRPGKSEEYDIVDECGIYVNGFCHWIAQGKFYPHELIVSLDLGNERFSTLSLPDAALQSYLIESDFVLMEFKKSLGLLFYPRKGIDKVLHPWVRVTTKDGRSRWTRKGIFKALVKAEKPLGYCRNGELLLLQGFDRKLLVYDSVAGESNKIDKIYDYPHCMQLFPYVESKVVLLAVRSPPSCRRRRFQNTSARPSTLLFLKRKREMLTRKWSIPSRRRRQKL